jgi:hypothetical protein
MLGVMRWVTMLLFVALAATPAQEPTLADGWAYARGRDTETLHVVHTDVPSAAAIVRLPHRVNLPNTALWYSRDLDLPAGASLVVDADDGAQVWVGGARWRGRGDVFTAERPVAAGTHRVIVRVLNNAAQGGLRRVSVVAGPASTAERLPAAPWFEQPESAAFAARMPAPGEPCRFTLWGDSQGGWDTFAQLVNRMSEQPHHFSAGAGDLVNDGSNRDAWRRLSELLSALAGRAAVVPVVGNHDYDGYYDALESEAYTQMFNRRDTWMAWTCGPMRVMAIDLNREFPLGIAAEQRRWIEAEVASGAWRGARWRVLLAHQPPYSRSWPGYDGDAPMRSLAHELVVRHGLTLVVAGHSHAYEHLVRTIEGRPLHILITGGGGGGLEPNPTEEITLPDRVIVQHHFVRGVASSNSLAFEVVGVSGVVLDRWQLQN